MTTKNKPNEGGRRGRTDRSKRKPAKPHEMPPAKRTIDLLERVNDGIVAFDAEMNYIYVNPRGAELLGRKPGDLIGKNYWAEFPEAKGTPFAEAYLRALETQKPIVFEDYYPPWDRWFENRIYPSKDGLTIFFTEITERKGTELKLRKSQEHLELTIRSANIGLWDWDLRSNKVHYSREWKGQLGYEDHEISDDLSEWESRVHPDDLERAKATVSAYIENPYPNFQNEFRMRHKDGSYCWILAQASLAYNGQGKPIRMIGSHIDITARKLAEEKLRQSEALFSKIFHSSPIGINIFRISDNRSFAVNDAFLKIIGYSRAEVETHTAAELNLFVDTEARNAWMRTLRGGGNVYNQDAKIRSKSGEIKDVLASLDLIEVNGEAMVLVIATDISDRKQAEENLRRNEQVLRLFVEHSPAAVAMFDREMNYIVASRRYLSDYELGEQNLIGCSHYEVFPEIPERWKEIHRRCLAGAIEKADEDPFPRKDGRLDWVRWEIRPWHETNGEIGGVILFSEVITVRKQAREELRLSRDRLADLSRRLVEAHETERRAIGRELHDQIGQMLTALKLTIEIAVQLPPEEALKKAAQGKELVEDLLNRVSALSLELRPPMLDDLGLLPALLWHVNRFQDQSGVEVEFKHSGIENRRFDPQIETTAYRIVQESLTNVARHARANRVRLEVRIRGAWMEIEIEDDGVGFDPQVALALNRGLNGMRERVQLVGGIFQIESETGKGARKFIHLPLREEQE